MMVARFQCDPKNGVTACNLKDQFEPRPGSEAPLQALRPFQTDHYLVRLSKEGV
jgi:hypothetical protein